MWGLLVVLTLKVMMVMMEDCNGGGVGVVWLCNRMLAC
jgi:hypothetical protein